MDPHIRPPRPAAGPTRRRTALASLAVLSLGLAACGDDDATGPAPGGSAPVTAPAVVPGSTTPTTVARPGAGTLPTAPVPTTAAPPTASAPSLADVRVRVVEVVQAEQPIDLVRHDGVLYVAERVGTVRPLVDGRLGNPIADLRDRTSASGEQGLLGVAFSPDGTTLYAHYTDRNGTTTVDALSLGPDGAATDRRTLLTQPQPFANHNGGQLSVGPDGLLYLGLGDGGSANDPQRSSLDLGTWLGKILRIDPTPSADAPYTVPADNPYVGVAGARPEIWAIGLRNPWRFSWDRATGDLWVSDVGQNRLEEINVVPAPNAGRAANFGWSAFEASDRFNDDQPPDGALPPLHQYEHGDLGCSVTGGFVYRGSAIPALQGSYVFGDYCASGVRAVDPLDPATAVRLSEEPAKVVAFGEDDAGELYVLTLDGLVARLAPA